MQAFFNESTPLLTETQAHTVSVLVVQSKHASGSNADLMLHRFVGIFLK